MNKISVRDINKGLIEAGEYQIEGWIRTHRQSKKISFIELSDGSSVKGVQLVIDPELESYKGKEASFTTGAAIVVKGVLQPSPAKGQAFEMQVSDITLVGECSAEDYALQKKGHSLEFLREHLHLRARSNTFGGVFRIRSAAAFSIHKFFQDRNFVYLTTPIITTSDCEGAGDMFRVTTLDLNNLPQKEGKIDFKQDFFGSEASLTVSGQLEAETFACALSNVYTFGPTFRAENSNTTRHLAEFWMVEPEMAFCDLEGDMKIAQDFIVTIIKDVLDACEDDLDFLAKREWVTHDLLGTLRSVVQSQFKVLTYTEAIQVLEKSAKSFEYPVKWGIDLQSEHEKYLTDEYVKGPLFVIDYPEEIKAFYMRRNEDGKTVKAMDLLVPQLGEIIGGSQREERLDVLIDKMNKLALPVDDYQWYLDLRRYGSVPHAGFGLGFERFLMYITGMCNIRDVIPFPRYPGFAKF